MARSDATPAARPARPRAGSEISATSSLLESDKENDRAAILGKRNTMTDSTPSVGSAKRRKLTETQTPNTQAVYDPDQSEDVTRAIHKSYRKLQTYVGENRGELLKKDNRGIQKTIEDANAIYEDVKQTSTATLDSRLLVDVSDLANKKITTMTLGESSTGIDLDDFISKCIAYMKTSLDGSQPTATQRRRRRQDSGSDEEEEEELPDLDWAYMGKTLCFQANRRPCLSCHLLGPLSVQKKMRQQTQRRATQRTQPTGPLVRPVVLDAEELHKQEAASLTSICTNVAAMLDAAQEEASVKVEQDAAIIEEEEGQAPSAARVKALMRKNHISENGGVPLLNFCINPKSFGQTVENLFYVSFLVKEGKVGLAFDEDDVPTLSICIEKTIEERQEVPRNQAVFHLDHDVWQELINNFGITKSIIPHRETEDYELDDGVILRPLAAAGTQQSDSESSSEDEDMYN